MQKYRLDPAASIEKGRVFSAFGCCAQL